MDFNKEKYKFGSWADPFKFFIESSQFDDIFIRLRDDKKRGRIILPDSSQTFNAFSKTNINDLKAVFIFNDPYSIKIADKPLADGLALSCSNTKRVSPLLEVFYRGMERDISKGFDLDMIDNPDLSYLADQGVLMLNCALTVEISKPGSHLDLWRPFMEYFFSEVLNTYEKSLPVIFMGKAAHAYKTQVVPFHHWVFDVPFPEKKDDSEADWNQERIFSKVNELLQVNYQQSIQWYSNHESVLKESKAEAGTTG